MPTTAPPVSPSRAGRRGVRVPGVCLAALMLALTFGAGEASAQEESKQVTLFGIRATPGSKYVDPRLSTIAPQLRQILPGHGFKLIDARTRRLGVDEAMKCKMGSEIEASAELLDPLDANGKVQLRFGLTVDGQEHVTIVTTPANQLFFADRPLADGSRLLLGMGAR
ncbi:hypothetical protein EP7_000146 [Isosphaeraceae bacterium EP7]